VHIEGLELIGPADGLQRSPARGGDSTGVRVELRFLPRRGAFALTDGNCIIIEENAHFTDAELINNIYRNNRTWSRRS